MRTQPVDISPKHIPDLHLDQATSMKRTQSEDREVGKPIFFNFPLLSAEWTVGHFLEHRLSQQEEQGFHGEEKDECVSRKYFPPR